MNTTDRPTFSLSRAERYDRSHPTPPNHGVRWSDEEVQRLFGAFYPHAHTMELTHVATAVGRQIRSVIIRLERHGMIYNIGGDAYAATTEGLAEASNHIRTTSTTSDTPSTESAPTMTITVKTNLSELVLTTVLRIGNRDASTYSDDELMTLITEHNNMATHYEQLGFDSTKKAARIEFHRSAAAGLIGYLDNR